MSTTISIDDARQELAQFVSRAAAGEEILITRNGKTLARLIAARSSVPMSAPVPFGRVSSGVYTEFDTPLPDEIEAAFQRRA